MVWLFSFEDLQGQALISPVVIGAHLPGGFYKVSAREIKVNELK